MLSGTFSARAGLALMAIVALAGATQPAWADGPTLVVAMSEPFEIDGKQYPAGKLSLRSVHRFTPTTTLNEIWVGDRCLGLMMAVRTDDPRLEASRNAVLFSRGDAGRLVLRGFAYRLPGAGERYRFELLRPGAEVASARANPVLLASQHGG